MVKPGVAGLPTPGPGANATGALGLPGPVGAGADDDRFFCAFLLPPAASVVTGTVTEATGDGSEGGVEEGVTEGAGAASAVRPAPTPATG